MSYSLIRSVVAGLVAASAPCIARATDINLYPGNQGANLNVNVFISGELGSGIDTAINAVLTSSSFPICQPGTVSEYDDNEVFDRNRNLVYGEEKLWYCQAGIFARISTEKYIAVMLDMTAGSVNSVLPLINVAKGRLSGLEFLDPEGPDVFAGTCPDANGGGSGCTTADYLQNVVPSGGVSGVEGNLLRTVPGGGIISYADVNKYLSTQPYQSGYDSVIGVAVTKGLYYALQQSEHLTDGTVLGCSTTGNDNPACAPSLTKEQIASLLLGANNANGNLLAWNQIAGVTNATDNNVYICERNVGSAIEASFEAYFLGARCGSSSESVATQDGHFAIESATPLSLLRCMEAFDVGGIPITPYNLDFGTTYPVYTPTGGQWAIGIVSTELARLDINQAGDTIRLVAVDGVLPTLANVVNGFYPYFSSSVWYTIGEPYPGSPSGDTLTVFNDIEEYIGEPVIMANLDVIYARQPWGSGGVLSSASLFATNNNAGYTTFPVTTAEVESNPINVFTRASFADVNSCETPVLSGNVNTGLTQKTAPEGVLIGSKNVNQ